MGQTLTHGIYLPDKGERNCYSGLAANWQILDSSVGTIAEHTTALAGKAPLVHTHTKADITDFPAYGATAGTICEGNDSRLSDARTPVAHTHTKSEVTDLLNSNFIPSANNSYDLGSSNYQWKTFNGINPGALSLPSSHYVAIDTTGWDLTGATYNRVYINNANPTFPGILFIRINSTNPSDILVKLFSTSGSEITYAGSKMEAGSNNMIVTVPCPPSTNIYVSTKTSSTITVCRYYTLLGDPKFDSRSGS